MQTQFLQGKRRVMLLATALFPFMGHAAPKAVKESHTPGGPVSLTTTTVKSVPQTIVPVTGTRLAAIRAMGQQAVPFLTFYRPGSDRSLREYDAAFRAWQNDLGHQFSGQAVIERLGAHLGNLMVADLGMEWVEVRDEVGTDFAVLSKKYEVISYPFSSVAKRVEKGEYDFMEGVYYAVKEMLASAAKKRRQ